MKKKLKKVLMKQAKQNLIFRKIFRKSLNAYRYIRYKIRGIKIKVDDKTILFSTFDGKSYADSSKAIYLYMQSQEKFKDYNFIWVFKKPENYKFLKQNINTKVVKSGTKKHEKSLLKAKYWVVNHRAADHIHPRKNQVYLQCWHGTPLKRLGCDLQKTDNALNTTNELKQKYRTEAKKFTYMTSPSKFATEKFISSFDLKRFKKEKCIIEEGYPRNDFLYNYTDEDVVRIKRELGIEDINKKIILYAPTWRDNQHEAGVGYTYKTEVDFEKLQKELGEDYIILFRAHYFVANKFDFEKYEGFIYNVSNVDDINELYVVADMLITDYSSVFFDYANLKRPIIFYMYDIDMYKNDMRGFYIDLNELPGSIITTEDGLIEDIKNATNEFKYDEKYEKFNNKYNYLDDGEASTRVMLKILEGGIKK